MLELYKKNPELMESTMKRSYDFYANDGLKDNYKPSEEIANLQFDKRISNLLLDYGYRTEVKELDNAFENFLVKIKRRGKKHGKYVQKLRYCNRWRSGNW